MKKTVRIFTAILVLILIIAAIPTSALAAGTGSLRAPEALLPGHGAPSNQDDHIDGHEDDCESPYDDFGGEGGSQQNEPRRIDLTVEYTRQVNEYDFVGIVGTATYEDGSPAGGVVFSVSLRYSANSLVEKTNDEGVFSLYHQYGGENTLYFTVNVYNTDKYICEPVSFTAYITGDSRSVTVAGAERGTAYASADSAKLGDKVTLTAEPDEGYWLKGWEVVKGGVTIEDGSFIMPSEEVEIRPVFDIAAAEITIDCSGHGDDIIVEVKKGLSVFESLYGAGVFETLDERETAEYVFRDLASKPLSEFNDFDTFNEDGGDTLDTIVESDMTLYACFFTKVKSIDLSVRRPVAGMTAALVDGVQTTPGVNVAIPSSSHCHLSADADREWFTLDENEWWMTFEGEFKEGDTYYTYLLIEPEFGYYLDDDTVVNAAGGTVVESYGRLCLSVSLEVQAAAPVLGDADGDGAVTILDVTVIQRALANYTVAEPQLAEMCGDVNGSGLDITDATLIQRYLANYTTAYAIGEAMS